MTFNKFRQKAVKAIGEYYGDTHTVEAIDVAKNNGIIKKGIRICERGNNISPTIYLEDAYDSYSKDGDFTRVFNYLIKSYETHKIDNKIDSGVLTDFDFVKDRIIYKLINTNSNMEYLKDIPHVEFMDMAIVFYYPVLNDDIGMATVVINKSMADLWKVDENRLLELATNNTPRIMMAEICDMWDLLFKNKITQDMSPSGTYFQAMYVITNNHKLYGASAILYPGVLEEFSKKAGTNLYVLPSSIHEMIIVPEKCGMKMESFGTIVRDVNRTQVDPMEVLSDSVYYYDREVKELRMLESLEM